MLEYDWVDCLFKGAPTTRIREQHPCDFENWPKCRGGTIMGRDLARARFGPCLRIGFNTCDGPGFKILARLVFGPFSHNKPEEILLLVV